MTVSLVDYLDRTVRLTSHGSEFVGRLRFDVGRGEFYVLDAQGNRRGACTQRDADRGRVAVSLYGAARGARG